MIKVVAVVISGPKECWKYKSLLRRLLLLLLLSLLVDFMMVLVEGHLEVERGFWLSIRLCDKNCFVSRENMIVLYFMLRETMVYNLSSMCNLMVYFIGGDNFLFK